MNWTKVGLIVLVAAGLYGGANMVPNWLSSPVSHCKIARATEQGMAREAAYFVLKTEGRIDYTEAQRHVGFVKPCN